MYKNEDLEKELAFYRRSNGHFEIQAGKSTCQVEKADDTILYMCMSASLVMDYSEDGFFENFIITDKSISGKDDMQIDAYAFIETDNSLVKHLHIFQYKIHDTYEKSASTVELLNFTTFVNNNFVHPEFNEIESPNSVVKEIKAQYDEFLNGRRGRRIIVYCHFINNAKGVTKSNGKQIEDVMGRFLHDKQTLGFSIQVNGLTDILDLAHNGKISVANETLDLIIDSPKSYRHEDNSKQSRVGLPKSVIIGMCNVNEFIRLQNKYHHNQLYTENIRLYLGDRGSVNKDIIRTITCNDSIWFPYMNNGISIICDKMIMGNVNTTKGTQELTLTNMQIINGCQTVNALYNAKYGESTKDNFRAANVMVRIYEIDPEQIDFKMSIIKATNNQNAVKSYTLMANDPIQIEIANVLKHFDIIYDRKGEAKDAPSEKRSISMTSVALSYRAVYLFMAKSLRSGLGKSRVFMKNEYEKVFDPRLIENDNRDDFHIRCIQLIISSCVLDTVRDLIPDYSETYSKKLPIIKKSAYYLAGYVYAYNKKTFDEIASQMFDVFQEDNDAKLRGMDFPNKLVSTVRNNFETVLNEYYNFYKNIRDVEKRDIDNLLKDENFEKGYMRKIEELLKKNE